MGFWQTLKFWDTQAVIEATMETTQKLFDQAKAKSPDRDCHAWLAFAYGARPGYTVAPVITFTRTTLFSVVGDDAPTALAYYLLTQEMPKAVPRFNAAFEQLLQPVFELVRQGRFLQCWEQTNPWTAANIPALREVVAESIKTLQQGLVQRDHPPSL